MLAHHSSRLRTALVAAQPRLEVQMPTRNLPRSLRSSVLLKWTHHLIQLLDLHPTYSHPTPEVQVVIRMRDHHWQVYVTIHRREGAVQTARSYLRLNVPITSHLDKFERRMFASDDKSRVNANNDVISLSLQFCADNPNSRSISRITSQIGNLVLNRCSNRVEVGPSKSASPIAPRWHLARHDPLDRPRH
ncbi:hypothetical protein N431DRAFT_425916 [Stipitochalara longipes BDJ]|nr:hypothetical protein N431DRAFT_425916 [Stipitochalara longipes BDJ]